MGATSKPHLHAMHLHDALLRHEAQYEANGRSPHSVAQVHRHVVALERWLVAENHSLDLEDVDETQIAAFLCSDAATKRPDGQRKKATSMNALRSSVRSFFLYCAEAGLVKSNPARLVRMALTSPGPPRALRDHEEAKLLAVLEAADGHEARRDHLLLRFLLGTGARLSSALALRVEDLDLEEGVAHLGAVKRGGEQTVYLSDRLRGLLADHVGGRQAGPVFASRSGAHLSSRHVQRRVRQLRERAGLSSKVTAHALRHRFALSVYQATGDLLVVKAALGHASLSSSVVYARVSDDRVREAVTSL